MQSTSHFDRSKWWPSTSVDTATAVVAECLIPAQTVSKPISSCLNLRSVLYEQPIRSVLKAGLDTSGKLIVGTGRHVNWISFLRIADNCEDKNIEVDIDPFSSDSIILKTCKIINPGQELKAWMSISLLGHLQIPFLSPSNIINHQLYRCIQCGTSFNQPNPLKIHIAFACETQLDKMAATPSVSPSISSFSPVQCPLTPTRSDSTASPRIEKRSLPTKEPKTHICIFCGKLYTRKYGLKIHLRTHTGHKPLQCRFCGRPFSDPSNLNKHIRLHAHHRMHLSSSPYKCTVCGKIMIRRRDLDRHVKSRHESCH